MIAFLPSWKKPFILLLMTTVQKMPYDGAAITPYHLLPLQKVRPLSQQLVTRLNN